METPSPPIHVVSLIRRKRDGHALSPAEIRALVAAYTAGSVPDYQMSSMLMALFLRGFSTEELLALTEAMLHSGQIVDLSFLPGPKVDKHSTGGVGDKVSIPLAPAVAACGVYVPMISGRGLGTTGGTLDKLDSIPGFQSTLSIPAFRDALKHTHMALIGQTAELAPADRKLYALRDVTGTVESIPLIVASILSKKLAEGIDGLVLDVKVGRGALMKTLPDAKKLAETLLSVARGAGKKASALITAMDEPLGMWVGNAAEINESVEIMQGRGCTKLRELTCALGGEMLRLAGTVRSEEEGARRIAQVLDNGQALQAFVACLAEQGSSLRTEVDLLQWTRHNLHPPIGRVIATEDGYIRGIDAEEVGTAGIWLGVGRAQLDSIIDPGAFIRFYKKTGDAIRAGDVLCEYGSTPALPQENVSMAHGLLEKAFLFQKEQPKSSPLILERYT